MKCFFDNSLAKMGVKEIEPNSFSVDRGGLHLGQEITLATLPLNWEGRLTDAAVIDRTHWSS